ncbi:MAG: endonuclease III [bacterium]
MKKKVDITKIVEILENHYTEKHVMESNYEGSPYKSLVACILSLRNLDEVTFPIADRLFEVADTPQKIINLGVQKLQEYTKSINYYKTKAENIMLLSQQIIDDYNGEVPETIDELMKFRGVGRKTANITISVGFQRPAVAVDTHVHKIANRLGYVSTETPDETEMVLRKKLPQKYWRKINQLFVIHGKTICKTRGVKCNICPIIDYCNQIGVK